MIMISMDVIGIYAGDLCSYAWGGRIAAGGGLFAGGPFAAGLIAGGLFASGLNAAPLTPCPGSFLSRDKALSFLVLHDNNDQLFLKALTYK